MVWFSVNINRTSEKYFDLVPFTTVSLISEKQEKLESSKEITYKRRKWTTARIKCDKVKQTIKSLKVFQKYKIEELETIIEKLRKESTEAKKESAYKTK